MTFYDLQQAVARLATDPRIEPNTPVEVEQLHGEEVTLTSLGSPYIAKDTWCESLPAISLALRSENGGRSLVLSSLRAEPAVAR
jgi:hypothetical protein